MTDYKKRFDDLTAPAILALNGKRDEFRSSFFNTDVAYVRRLLERLSAGLQRVDAGPINHPTYLAGAGQPFPEKAIQLISSMPSAINDSGINHFINSMLPELVAVDDGISRAIGINEIRSAEIKSSQLRTIEKYVDWTKNAHANVSNLRTEVTEDGKKVKLSSETIGKLAQEAGVDAKKIRDTRTAALRLSGGTKTSPALSVIMKEAQSKLTEIETNRDAAIKLNAELVKLGSLVVDHELAAGSAMERLSAHDKQAKDILNNATQAGLAGAFKIEREKLAKQQFWYAMAFYGIILSIVVYAAVFIVPIASQIILNHKNQSVTIGESALLLFVRILIVLPAFWALIFTNRRFVYLETLQMDYAAKAVTALAYSGYRDEMGDDQSLSARLRRGLVERFIEHPSRLLGLKVDPLPNAIGNSPDEVTLKSDSIPVQNPTDDQ